MGFFSKFFEKNDKQPAADPNNSKEAITTESPVVIAEQNSELDRAYQQARDSFKYFWRELSWEHRRIVPAHGMAAIKVPFSQQFSDSEEPYVEHMWVSDIYFDGDLIYGKLLNTPNHLTNVKEGEAISVSIEEISDWMLSITDKVYGAFTVQLLRTTMDPAEREQHDAAWGLDFGDPNDIQVVYQQDEHPENLEEHPMSINMREKLVEFFEQNPEQIEIADEDGLTFLHRESIAGNRNSVEVLLEMGAKPNTKSKQKKTALDYAVAMNWLHLIPLLKEHQK